jgi:hypothetical protein
MIAFCALSIKRMCRCTANQFIQSVLRLPSMDLVLKHEYYILQILHISKQLKFMCKLFASSLPYVDLVL